MPTFEFPSQRKFFFFKAVHKQEIGLLWPSESFEGESTILDLDSPSNFQVKEKKLLKSVKKQRFNQKHQNRLFKMDVRMSRYRL